MALTVTPLTTPDRRQNRRKHTVDGWARRAPLFPALILTIVVTQLLFVATLLLSLFNYQALLPNERAFVGLDNYITVFTTPSLLSAVSNTIVLTVSVVIVSLVVGMGIALLLDRKFLGRGAVRTMMIAPFLIVPAAGALVFKHAIYNYSNGLINGVLTSVWSWFGSATPPQFSIITDQPMLAIQILLIWQWTPFMMLILLAGLQARPQDVLEAAAVDGAGPWRVFVSITIPQMRQYLELGGLLGSIYIVQNFDAVRVLTEGSLGTANLPYAIYQTFSKAGDYGLASAQGVLAVIGSILIATFALRVVFGLIKEEGAR